MRVVEISTSILHAGPRVAEFFLIVFVSLRPLLHAYDLCERSPDKPYHSLSIALPPTTKKVKLPPLVVARPTSGVLDAGMDYH